MSTVKKQHFVPQFYLENFTNAAGKIFVFDFPSGQGFGTTVENVAHKKFFYDFEPLDNIAGEQSIEKALSKFEGESAKIFSKIISMLNSRAVGEFTLSERKALAEYIIIQQSRTVESRIQGQQLADEIERQLKSKGASEEFITNSGLDPSKYNAKVQQLNILLSLDMEERVSELCDRSWVYWDNQSKHKFYTSDHPVIGHLHEDISFSAYELYFPLTPRFALSILIKKEFSSFSDKHNSIVTISDPENIAFYNSLLITNCHRQVYNSENDFRFVSKMLKQFPSLANPDRQRIAHM